MPQLKPIGELKNESNTVFIRLKDDYAKGLKGLSGCDHIHVICVSLSQKLFIMTVKANRIDEKKGEIEGIRKGYENREEVGDSLDVIDIKPYFPCEDYARYSDDAGDGQAALSVGKTEEGYHMDYEGEIRNTKGTVFLQLNRIPQNVADYIKVVWWFHRFEDKKYRRILLCDPPYECKSKIGVFASRSPVRPNPIAITVAKVIKVDRELNRIYISNIESFDHTPLLGFMDYDIRSDRIDDVRVPEWAENWPDCMDEKEESVATANHIASQLDHKIAEVLLQCENCYEEIEERKQIRLKKPTHIEVKGARENNLKGINVTIPYGKITAVVGVSGSGKSSLVMDTVYAECKRRMEYLSSENVLYMRPDMDEMLGCIPTVCITQKEIRSGSNSTIGTFSGIYHHLRTIYASIGTRNYIDKSKAEFKMTPSMFSFNDPECRCGRCNGTGYTQKVDIEKLITDNKKSLLDGASPFLGKLRSFIQNPNANWMKGQVVALAEDMGISLELPWEELPEEFKNAVLYGDESRTVSFSYDNKKNHRKGEIVRKVEGMVPIINRLYLDSKAGQTIGQFMSTSECEECHGERLNKEGRLTTVEGIRYPICAKMTFAGMRGFVELLERTLDADKVKVIEEQLKAIAVICETAKKMGIENLHLDRRTDEISGGEAQRLKLLLAFQNHMTGILYIFDEPSKKLGLHEYKYIIDMMKVLIDEGNTILMVEHNMDMIKAADYIIEIGPKPGIQGGYLVGEGKYQDIVKHEATMLGKYEGGENEAKFGKRREADWKFIDVQHVTANNLRDVSISFPKNALTCITGNSGSGKSTLMYHGILKQMSGSKEFDQVICVESKLMTGSSRSVVATYIGIMDGIRDLFAGTKEARENGLQAKDFSFNSGKCRCEFCRGEGRVKIEFTQDSYRTCPQCHGGRYRREYEKVKYKGKSISEILRMSVEQAKNFFEEESSIRKKCELLSRFGLSYLTLGHGTNTLSGGEASRLKIANLVMNLNVKNTLFLLDEPTCGLHFSDIDNLLSIVSELIDSGNTVITIEHNRRYLAAADYTIDMSKADNISS